MQNHAFLLLLACAPFWLLSCGQSAQIDEPPLPLELELYPRTYSNNETYVYAEIWRGDTPFDINAADSLFLDYFWTIEGNTVRRKLEQKLSNGSDGRSEILARFTVVDIWGDTLSDTLRVELPLWFKLVSPVHGYVARVGERIRFVYQSNKPVQLELWQCRNEACEGADTIPVELAEQGKLGPGSYYWGIQRTPPFRYLEVSYLEVRPQEQP
jgi:hypothetical protein